MKFRENVAAVLSACLLLALPFVPRATAGEDVPQDRGQLLDEGSLSFNRYCESCHGPKARGDGVVAQYLKVPPADLTLISARRDGDFPSEEIREIIDGRRGVRGHGSDMPIWGDAFQRTEETEDEAVIGRKIDALIYYLRSIQEKSAPAAGRSE